MNVVISLDEIITHLEKYLDQYDKILIFASDKPEHKEFSKAFMTYLKARKLDKKYLLITNDSGGGSSEPSSGGVDIAVVSNKDMDSIMEIYRMYEFSDRLTVISDNNYPSILNYLYCGVLKEKECYEALLS